MRDRLSLRLGAAALAALLVVTAALVVATSHLPSRSPSPSPSHTPAGTPLPSGELADPPPAEIQSWLAQDWKLGFRPLTTSELALVRVSAATAKVKSQDVCNCASSRLIA
jgi:hypothetical protein